MRRAGWINKRNGGGDVGGNSNCVSVVAAGACARAHFLSARGPHDGPASGTPTRLISTQAERLRRACNGVWWHCMHVVHGSVFAVRRAGGASHIESGPRQQSWASHWLLCGFDGVSACPGLATPIERQIALSQQRSVRSVGCFNALAVTQAPSSGVVVRQPRSRATRGFS